MRRARLLIALTTLFGAGVISNASPAFAACSSSSKASFAKVQLWRDANCGGGSMIVPTSGDDDRSNFATFRNYDGKTYNIDNSRSSVSLQGGWCVKFFDATNYGGAESVLYCATTTATYHSNIGSFDNRATSMRTCPNSARTQCNKTPTTPPAGSPPPPPPPADGDPIVTGEPETGSGEGVVDPGAEPVADPPADPVASEGGDPVAGGEGGSDLGSFGPDDGLQFNRAGRKCSGGSTQGALALRIWLVETAIPARRQAGIYACSKRRRTQRKPQNLHGEGRAVDFQPASRAGAEQLIGLLLADGFSLARRMGIQEIIYDGTVWSAARPSPVLRRYRGSMPHRKSVHIGLNRKGARKRTSFWAGR